MEEETFDDIDDLLDAVKVMHGLDTDYKLAKLFAVSTGRIANYRAGGNLSNDMAIKIAAALNVHPMYVLSLAGIKRAKNETELGVWKEQAKKFAKFTAPLAIAILAGCSLALAPLPHFTPDAAAHDLTIVYYVKSLVMLSLALIAATCQLSTPLLPWSARRMPPCLRTIVR